LTYILGLFETIGTKIIALLLLFALGYFLLLSIDVTKNLLQAQKTIVSLQRAMKTLQDEYKTYKSFGFEHPAVKIEKEVKLDGGCRTIRTYRLRATRNGLSLRRHFHEAGVGSWIAHNKTDFRVSKGSEEHIIKESIIEKTDTRCIRDVKFMPPLHKDDEVEYRLISETEKSFLMTKEDILGRIQEGNWVSDEVCEYTRFYTLYPTENLVFEVTFPEGYRIEGEKLFDVTVGKGIQTFSDGLKTIEKNNGFSAEVLEGPNGSKRTTLRLVVEKPDMGMAYWIRWVPPSTKDYLSSLSSGEPTELSMDPERPFTSLTSVFSLVESLKGSVQILDKDINEGVFKFLIRLDDDRVDSVQILGGKSHFSPGLRDGYKAFKDELKNRGIAVEYRILDDSDARKIHDRYLIAQDVVFNTPPWNIIHRKLGDIIKIDGKGKRKYFNKCWSRATNILKLY